jgi:beta-glucosidase
VYALTSVHPLNKEKVHVDAAKNARYLLNEMFIDGVTKGVIDEKWDGNQVPDAYLQQKRRLDYLGVNYYTKYVIDGTLNLFPLRDLFSKLFTFLPTTAGDFDYPRGIYEVIKEAHARYKVPMIVTETGAEAKNDPERVARWLASTLAWTRVAMSEGAKVSGYFSWTLMDNYEWNHGMSAKLGLYAVNPDVPEKTRTARSAVAVYGRIAQTGRIPQDLAERYGVGSFGR